MADYMEFPKTMEEFIDGYSFNDSEKVYTNGVDLIPVYRVIQGFGHYEQEIRNKAIDELVAIAMERFTALDLSDILGTVTSCKIILRDIAEQMKGE